MRQNPPGIFALTEEMHAVGDLRLVAEAAQPVAQGAVAEDQEVGAGVDPLEQIGVLYLVVDPFLRPEPAHQSDQLRVRRQPELLEQAVQ